MQREYLHFSVILRPWVLVRPRRSNPRLPPLHSSSLPTELILPQLSKQTNALYLWFQELVEVRFKIKHDSVDCAREGDSSNEQGQKYNVREDSGKIRNLIIKENNTKLCRLSKLSNSETALSVITLPAANLPTVTTFISFKTNKTRFSLW